MAAQEEIVRILRVDTRNSDKSIRDLKQEIKSLRSELEKTTVGSEEFNTTLKRLLNTQKDYNEIQQQVRDMSKTNQQNMVNMASFARNLGKAYSALNAAIGLFANGNEDVQKAMLKVQRSIQLIQGLDGIAGLIRDLPKVASAFKGWLNSLSPIERSVDRIAKGINGIDPKKLKDIKDANAANRGGGSSSAAAAAAGGGNINVNTQQLQEQQKVIVPLNEEFEKYSKELSEARKTLKEWSPEMSRLSDVFEEYNLHTTQAKINMEEFHKAVSALMNGDPSQLHNFLKEVTLDIDALDETAKKFGYTNDQLIEGLKNLEEGLGDDSKIIESIQADLNGATKAAEQSTSAFKKFGGALKSIFATVGWTLLITALVTAAYKLLDYITNLRTAAKEQRALNKAISEGTNQIASKQIVILKELALGYERVGNSAEAKAKFIKDYADKIRETGIAVTDVNTADEVFINNTDKYVSAIMARAKAQATENKAIELYQEYLDKRYDIEEKLATAGKKLMEGAQADYTLPMGQGMNVDYENKLLRDSFNAILSQRDKLDADMEERLRKMFDSIADLENEYFGLLGGSAEAKATADAGTKELEDTIKQDLEALIQYYKEAEQVLSDEMVNAKQAIMDKYAERIALAEKYGRDTIELELAREKELADLEKQFAEQEANEEYQRIQTHIEQIRRMYDTANLREPTEQRYQTTYQQPPITRALGLMGLATGTDWINVYQSKEDVENQLKAQIEYNDQFYLLTKQRIEQENELLNQQLEIEGLSADQRMEIQRTLTENMIALSDAQLQNEQENLKAYLDAQEKRRQALNGILDVTSTLTGTMASMFRMQAEDAEEGSKKQKAATAAYKAFAITQAIADTWKGANEAYTAMASIPYVGPVLGAIAAGVAVASGIANVMAIKNESISGSTNVSSQASVSAPSALNTPPIEYTRNLIGDKELDEMNTGIKCYVLESDITTTQNKVKVTEQNASF